MEGAAKVFSAVVGGAYPGLLGKAQHCLRFTKFGHKIAKGLGLAGYEGAVGWAKVLHPYYKLGVAVRIFQAVDIWWNKTDGFDAYKLVEKRNPANPKDTKDANDSKWIAGMKRIAPLSLGGFTLLGVFSYLNTKQVIGWGSNLGGVLTYGGGICGCAIASTCNIWLGQTNIANAKALKADVHNHRLDKEREIYKMKRNGWNQMVGGTRYAMEAVAVCIGLAGIGGKWGKYSIEMLAATIGFGQSIDSVWYEVVSKKFIKEQVPSDYKEKSLSEISEEINRLTSSLEKMAAAPKKDDRQKRDHAIAAYKLQQLNSIYGLRLRIDAGAPSKASA